MLLQEINHYKRHSKNSFIGIIVKMMLILTLLLTIIPAQAKADVNSKIEIKTEIGFSSSTSQLKDNRLNPVKIILTSTENDVTGDIVVQTANPYGGKDISYIQHVELPKGVSKEVWFALPGAQYSKDNNVIRFYRKSVDSGSIIPLTGGPDYLYSSSSNRASVGVLSGDSDTFNFLSLLQQQNLNIEVIPLKQNNLPDDPLLYNSLDILAINNFPAETLSVGQIKAITGFVNSGGTLVLSGGAGFAKTAQAFDKLLPVQVQGTTTITDLSVLAQTASRELKLTEPFTLSNAKPLPNSEVIMKQGDVPLFVSSSHGSGRVIYAAYDVAEQPLASWNGHFLVWGELFQDEFKAYNGQNRINYGRDSYWMMDNALDYFPSIKAPPFDLLVVLLLIYAIVVAPVLYIILKKFDKREWSWVIIPSLAIVSSIVIYFAGASNKTSIIGHTLTTIALDGDGQGRREGGAALFVPTSGDYKVAFDNKALPQAFNTASRGMSNLNGEPELYIRTGAEVNELEFKNIPFWSVRKTMLQETESKQLGALQGELTMNETGQIEGKVTNNTVSDLKDAFVIFGGQVVKIGDIKRKDTVSVTLIAMTPTGNNMHYTDLGYQVYPHAGSTDTFERQRQFINYYSSRDLLTASGQPIFFAWTEDQGMNFSVDGNKIRNDQLTLWTQKLRFNVVKDNKIVIPRGYVKPLITEINSQNYGQDPMSQMINLSDGYVVAEYRLPYVANARYSELVIDNVSPNLSAELWDGVKQEWVAVDLRTALTLDQATLVPYIDRGRTIKLKISTLTGGDARLPDIAVKGEVSP